MFQNIRQRHLFILLLLLVLFSAGCATQSSQTAAGVTGGAAGGLEDGYSYDVYYVQRGDTLRSIGRREGVDWSRIAEANDCNPHNLRVGQTLLIPRYDGQPEDGIDDHSMYPPEEKPQTYHNISIVIDAGHGGKDPGAISPTGLQEKDVNLNVAGEVARQLRRRGVDVTLVRDDDTFVELNERAAIANRKRVDLFVSIHADSAKNVSARGFTVYVSRDASQKSRSLARAVVQRFAQTGRENRGVRRADFRVLVRTRCPAILVELGFLSNRKEAKMLASKKNQKNLAEDIVRGIEKFLQQQGQKRY